MIIDMRALYACSWFLLQRCDCLRDFGIHLHRFRGRSGCFLVLLSIEHVLRVADQGNPELVDLRFIETINIKIAQVRHAKFVNTDLESLLE